jgi:tetratricopeptide (TPR) repeat protein
MMAHWSEYLDQYLSARKVSDGFALWEKKQTEVAMLVPADTLAPGILARLAEWVDLGYRPPVPLAGLTERFKKDDRAKLTIKEFLELRLAEGFVAMAQEDVDKSIELLDFVLRAETHLGDDRLAAIVHFWKGRAHRKKGEYEEATQHIVRARQMMEGLGEGKLAAVIQIQESWLKFQTGKLGEARHLLETARQQLVNTDDNLSQGNIASAAGRVAQQEGHYAEALNHFEVAVDFYGKRDPYHRNLARALVNSATVKRLMALQLRRRIDEKAAKRGGAGKGGESKESLMARYNRICEEALGQLERARVIYERHQYHGGIAAVLVSSGYLHVDSGDVEKGAGEGWLAYRQAHEKNDHIHMARARTLQCVAANTMVEEQFGEDVDAAAHASNARSFGEEAVRWAEHTQNRRLIAEAYVARGMVHANEYFAEWEEARQCAEKATELLAEDARDRLWEELVALKARILRASSVDDRLRAWSEGMLGEKTFQQVTEEFAEIVIPRVWAREGKKVSRVAQKLQMSPKKVRRVLRNVGVHE